MTTIKIGVYKNYFQQCQNGGWRAHSEDTVLAEVTDIGLSTSQK